LTADNSETEGVPTPLYELNSGGARAAVGATSEEDGDLGEGNEEKMSTVRYFQDATKDAKSIVAKAERVRQGLAELTSSINQVRTGGSAAPLQQDLKALPGLISGNEMEQDVSNVAIDARNIVKRVNNGQFKVGPDAIRRAQDAHNPALMKPTRVQDAAESVLGNQVEVKENVAQVESLGHRITSDIENHKAEINQLGEVNGIKTEQLPRWVQEGADKLTKMEDALSSIAVNEKETSRASANAFQAQASDELGETQTETPVQKKYQFNHNFAGNRVNEGMRSMFTDP